jgi:anaerobic magnesium-protoporphyrin IX monomethyl ester cyclase
MRATLIFPGISCGWDCFGRQGMSTEAHFVSYGLAYIASYAKSQGHTVDLLDMRKLTGWDAFDAQINQRGPGVFAFSSMSVDYGTTAEAMAHIKKIDPRAIIVLGGVHATVATDEAAGNPDIDHIIVGEGEVSFSELLNQLQNGEKPQRLIQGISPDIDALPFPDRELFDYRRGELKAPWLPHMPAPFVSIISSRGCPFQCTFCQPAERMVFGGKARMRSVTSVISELEHLRYCYDFKSLLIHDDLFTFNPNWIEQFCDAYIENGFDQPFTCQARSDFIVNHSDIVKRMRDSGLSCFMIGFESGSQRILDFIKKRTTVEMNREAVSICKDLGIRIFANYMFGLPTETPEEVFQTVDFIRWAKPEYPSPAFFTPHPGSELFNYCQEHDLTLIQSHTGYRRNPTEPKIKGPDYDFLSMAVQRSTEHQIDKQIDYVSRLSVKNEHMRQFETELLSKKRELEDMDAHYRNYYNVQTKTKNKIGASKSQKKDIKRILVTGGTGFIGSELVRQLITSGHQVSVLTRNSKHPMAKMFASRGVQIYQGHIENREAMEELNGFDVIYHLAIFQGTQGSQMFEVNVGGTENMLLMARRNRVEKFIYASSIEAQGTTDSMHHPLDETSECHPVSDYGKSKLAGESLVLNEMNEHGMNAVVARIGNVYGAGGLSFIHPMASAIIERNIMLQALPVFAERIVQPIYIADLGRALVRILSCEKHLTGLYNFTGNQPASIAQWFAELGQLLDLADHVRTALEVPAFEKHQANDLRDAHPHINYFLSGDAPRIHRFYTDGKLKRQIGEYQSHTLAKGVAYALEWHHQVGLFNNYLKQS